MLSVIAGYDPKDEMTAFAVGRLPEKPLGRPFSELILFKIAAPAMRRATKHRATPAALGPLATPALAAGQ